MAREKRGDGYRVRWYTRDGRPRSKQVGSAREAKQLDDAIHEAHRAGRDYEPPAAGARARLDAVAAAYQDARRLRVRPDTLRVEGGHLDVFLRFAGERGITYLDELSRAVLDDFLGWCMRPGAALHGRTRKPGSAGRIVEAAWLLWRWAEDSERFAEVPRAPRDLELPRSVPGPVVAPTWAEMDACIAACGGWQRRLALWLRWTGLRSGESMLFAWSDLDIGAGLLTIRPEIDKNGEGRIIPLHPALLDEIATWGKREGYIVPCGRKAGEREREARGRDMKRAWVRAGARAAVYEQRPHHAFRRGFKSGLLALGAHPDAVDFLQGHTLGSGSRGRYIDGSALPLRETLALMPAVGSSVAGDNVVALRR